VKVLERDVLRVGLPDKESVEVDWCD